MNPSYFQALRKKSELLDFWNLSESQAWFPIWFLPFRFDFRTSVHPKWRYILPESVPLKDQCLSWVRTGFATWWCMQLLVLGPLGFALSSSLHHSALYLLAHPNQWFPWLPSIMYFHTLWVLCFAALEWPSSVFGDSYSLPHFHTPCSLYSSELTEFSLFFFQFVSAHCDEPGLAQT